MSSSNEAAPDDLKTKPPAKDSSRKRDKASEKKRLGIASVVPKLRPLQGCCTDDPSPLEGVAAPLVLNPDHPSEQVGPAHNKVSERPHLQPQARRGPFKTICSRHLFPMARTVPRPVLPRHAQPLVTTALHPMVRLLSGTIRVTVPHLRGICTTTMHQLSLATIPRLHGGLHLTWMCLRVASHKPLKVPFLR
jgi:hypothetical protein